MRIAGPDTTGENPPDMSILFRCASDAPMNSRNPLGNHAQRASIPGPLPRRPHGAPSQFSGHWVTTTITQKPQR